MVLEEVSSLLSKEQSPEGSGALREDFLGELELAGGLVALGLAAKFAPAILPKLTTRFAPAFSQASKLAGTMEQKVLNAGEGRLFGLRHGSGESELSAASHLAPVGKNSPHLDAASERINLPSFGWVGILKESQPEITAHHLTNKPAAVNVSSNSWLARLYEEKKAAVVSIKSQDGSHGGSGFFVDSQNRLLATNFHVIEGVEEQNQIVRLFNGKSYQARVIAYDPYADLAMLKIAGRHRESFQALELGEPLALSSKRAAAMGYPDTNRATAVISPGKFSNASFSTEGRHHYHMHSYFGNSGGPIFGRDGKVQAILKSGLQGCEVSRPCSIGVDVAHLRTMLHLVRTRKINEGPLEIETEILARGRNIFRGKDLLAMQKNPEQLQFMRERLAVRVVSSEKMVASLPE